MAGIYIWGTGCSAGELMSRLPEKLNIAGFVDSFPMGESFMDRPVLRPEELCHILPKQVTINGIDMLQIQLPVRAGGDLIPVDIIVVQAH